MDPQTIIMWTKLVSNVAKYVADMATIIGKNNNQDTIREFERQSVALEEQFNQLFKQQPLDAVDPIDRVLQPVTPFPDDQPDFFFEKPNRHVTKVFLHHTAFTGDLPADKLAKTIDMWHRQRGWAGIGYHYVIDFQGRVAAGRSLEKTPAAQGGHNTGTIAIVLNGTREDNFTETQLASLKEVCEAIDRAYQGNISFHGHKEVSATLCPAYDYKALLKLNSRGYME